MPAQHDLKITYATMSAEQMEDFHRAFDEAIPRVRSELGRRHPNYVNAQERYSDAGGFDDTSPIDTRILLGRFQKGTREDAAAAIAAARAAFPAGSATPGGERVPLMRRVADNLRSRRFELAALMGLEAGKNRLECMGDVEEAADLISYYCDQMDAHGGFEQTMGRLAPNEETWSVLRPYGVWAIISPFNFPLALAAGPSGGALAAGNTVVFKPATDTPYLGLKLYEAIAGAGLPPGVFNFVTGPGGTVGQTLADSPDVDGLLFTGSKEVGFELYRHFSRQYPKPCITEMGGKNPALVMGSADLDMAGDGVMRSAFGAQGQKCSACSRVYVDREVRARFVELLVEKTRKIKIGNPLDRDVWLGPVINKRAQQNFVRYVEWARKDGGRILAGGRALADGEFAHGYFVEPTIVDGLAADHPLFVEEMFVPIVCLAPVVSLDEALDLANLTEYGLTAGIYTNDEVEVRRFFDRIQAGVVYVNRRAGATTGAWPGVNPFGGWKGSGSSGKASGGPYYVQQFMREQSRTIIR